MDVLTFFFDIIVHVDQYIETLISHYGAWVYAILFMVVFVETGVVVMPLLPGDSLLFASGVTAAAGGLNIYLLGGLLIIAAIAGDAVNYVVGRFFGEKIIARHPKLIRPEYLHHTRLFFERYGGKAIVLARFVPIVRTIAPFLAGAGQMEYLRFARYNVVGAVLWVGTLLPAGYFLGSVPFVKDHLSLIVLGIVVVSTLVPIVEAYRARGKDNHTSADREGERIQ